MPLPESWANPNTTRSRVAIEMAAELVAMKDQPLRHAKVLLRQGVDEPWPLALFGSATIEGIEDVVERRSALAMINPSTALRMAYLGTGPFTRPQPVRLLAVLPSADQLVFAVKGAQPLKCVEDIGSLRYPLQIHTRGTPRHALQFMLASVAQAAGFSIEELRGWGGELAFAGGFPFADSPTIDAVKRGEIDALFEEGSDEWLQIALDAGMRVLELMPPTIANLEAIGFRRAFIRKERYGLLPHDIATVSFSGWPIFVHAELPDVTVRQFCAALDARKHLIPWQGEGPLPVERMCRDAEDTPIDVPLHPAAERFWRDRGYL